MRKIILIVFMCLLIMKSAYAYKQEVHMQLSEYAGTLSTLNGNQLWSDWGLDKETKFNYLKVNTKYHQDVTSDLNYLMLLRYGADAEDEDTGLEAFTPAELRSRAFNHFYNPQVNKKIDISLISALTFQPNFTSLDWVLEGNESPLVDNKMQQFSYADAQTYFYRAFTSRTAEQRSLNMGKMFQSLGHVIHHIQDMSQPEHTRLDKHCDSKLCKDFYEFSGHDDSSQYEQFTDDLRNCNALVTQISDADIVCKTTGGKIVWVGKPIYLGGYLPPVFSNASDYWHSSTASGLADFSSNNFITNDTVYQLTPYVCDPRSPVGCSKAPPLLQRLLPNSTDLPLPSGSTETTFISESSLSDILPPAQFSALPDKFKNLKMQFMGVRVKDNANQQSFNIQKMASFSILNERLQNLSGRIPVNLFATSNINLEEWSRTLLPRAVGYSAGIIDYFFRIRLQASLERSFGHPNVIFLKNISAYPFVGHVEFYYDDLNGNRKYHSSTERIIIGPNQKMKKFYRVEIPESQSQSKNFYAIAVEETSFNITKAVAAVTFTHDARINDPKPPVPCNQGISNTGGFETFSVIVNLGSNRGNVNVNYNMYTIPDSLAISKLSGPSARIYNSWGTISGNGSVSFAYDPSLFPDNAVNVVVQGGSAGTEWYVSVSCPK